MPRILSTGRKRGLAVVAAVVVTVGVGAALAAPTGPDRSGGPAATATAAPQETASEQEAMLLSLARRDPGDAHAEGRADAPVVLIEYSDFQCPFCGKFARDVKPELAEYVEDGTLRIEWRHFPIFGEESDAAARAGYAAARQGRFWQFHDIVYATERRRNGGDFAPGKLEEMARRAGVPDLARFRADMESDEARAHVERDAEEGYRIGVTSTPAFLVNTTPILGAQPAEIFEAAIAEALRKARAAGAEGAGR